LESSDLSNFTVIAHRGASGYLPEHTLESAAMAHAMGVDFIELDVVLTQDSQLIVLHDLSLEAVTDVRQRYPGRHREDGRFYAIDFSLEEIRGLRVHERVNPDGSPAFPDRFPPDKALFRIPAFSEEAELIRGLNRSSGRNIGLYIEPKAPAWHAENGQDILGETIRALAAHGYQSRSDNACLQSFDMEALKRARFELETDLKLVQLIGENSWKESDTEFDFLRTREGLREVSRFADGIGPWILHSLELTTNNSTDISDLVPLAHEFGLFVHAYTLRADQIPDEIGGIGKALDLLTANTGLDGVFTDHPDQVLAVLPPRS
jgi:glycerophosphoryl diester phosphodiesterase